MRNVTLAFLFALVVIASGSAFAEDVVQDAYAKFETTTSSLQQQLYAKQTELDTLIANNQAQSPRVQELFREIGELRGQLYLARTELQSTLNSSGGVYPRHGGIPFRSGPGYGGCRSGYGYCCGYGYPGYNGGGRSYW